MVRASLRALPALFAFRRVNVGTVASDRDRLKIAGIDAGLPDTVLAVVRHDISGNRAILTSRADHLYDIAVIHLARRLPLRKADPLADDLPFFINAAAEHRLGAGDHLIGKGLLFLVETPFKGQARYFAEYGILDAYNIIVLV